MGFSVNEFFGRPKTMNVSAGKYKKVRFKGIICDKCGVEVARSKVRKRTHGTYSNLPRRSVTSGLPKEFPADWDFCSTLRRVIWSGFCIFLTNIVTSVIDENARQELITKFREKHRTGKPLTARRHFEAKVETMKEATVGGSQSTAA